MEGLASLLMLLIIAALLACFVQLSARLLRRMRVSWKQTLAFIGLLFVVAVLGRLAEPLWGSSVPALLPAIVGLAINLVIGTWFFSTRATTADGQAVGRLGAFKLTALALGMMVGLSLLFALLGALLAPASS